MKESYKEIQENTKKFNKVVTFIDCTYQILLMVVVTMAICALCISCEQNTEIPCVETTYSAKGGNTSMKSNGKNRETWNGNLSLSQDMTIDGNWMFKNGINLNGHVLTCNGQLTMKGSQLNGGGYLVCGSFRILYPTKKENYTATVLQNDPIIIETGGNTLGMDEVITVQEYYDCE